MSAEQATQNSEPTQSYPPPSGSSQTGLGIAVIGAVLCLLAASALVAAFGVGRWVVARTQEENATATAWAENDSATATAVAQSDNATATARAGIVLPPPGWSLKMDEQFTSDDNSWYTGSTEDDLGIGEFAIDNECYQWQVEGNSEEGIGWQEFPGFSYGQGNFFASVDCRLINGKTKSSYCGLLLRYLDGENYLRYAIADAQFMHIGLRKEDRIFDLLPWEYTYLVRTNEVNQVAVLAVGIHYTFFINGQVAYELDDDRLSNGEIGLLAGVLDENKAEFQFDNFQLYEP